MPIEDTWAGPAVAAERLRVMLARPGRYRDRWMPRAEKPRDNSISQAAVARVIVDYLVAEGEISARDRPAHRRLKDRVQRALSGKAFSEDTLRWFIHAFVLSDDDANTLWSCLTGASTDRPAKLAPPVVDATVFRPTGCRKISIHERHILSADGRLDRHEATEIIEAIVDKLSSFPLRLFDMRSVQIADLAGAEASVPYRCDDGAFAIDLTLPRTLRQGERATISYTLRYEADEPSLRRFQRGSPRELENVKISVCFSAERTPEKVYWATWREFGSDAKPLMREPVTLDKDYTVSKEVEAVQSQIVGFFWEWNDQPVVLPRQQS